MRTVVVIPAFNESERIARTVGTALAIPGVERVIVVDDCSADETAEKAAAAGAEVLRLQRNVGKGGALEAGLDVARDADVVLLLDGDLGETAAEAAKLLEPVAEGRADMTIAMFPRATGKAGFGLVKNLARLGIRVLGGPMDAQAPLSGQRALTRRAVEAVTPVASGYGVEVALTIRALRAGLRVVEVPTTMAHAATGRDLAGFRHRGRQFRHVLAALALLAIEPKRRSG